MIDNFLVLSLFNNCAVVNKMDTQIQMGNEYFDLKVNNILEQDGYVLLHPNFYYDKGVLKYISENRINLDATFWKSWESVKEKTEFELLIFQLLHYMTTYGTGFTEIPFIPEDVDVSSLEKRTKFKYIDNISEIILFEKLCNLSYSGIALKTETVEIIMELFEQLGKTPDIDKVKNRELKLRLIRRFELMPSNPEECVKYLFFVLTGSTLFINSKQHRFFLKLYDKETVVYVNEYMNKYGLDKLSQCFKRYKWFFLGLKQNPHCDKNLINKIRKLSDKNHVPVKANYFNELLNSNLLSYVELSEKASKLNNFQLIKLINEVRYRIAIENDFMDKPTKRLFLIRNGKSFFKEMDKGFNSDYYHWINIRLTQILISNLSKKGRLKVKLNKNLNIALPTSEKQFLGNIPFYSSVFFSGRNKVVGINWNDKEGLTDLDLSMYCDGINYGWNNYHKNGDSILYSGDITYPNPEATELFFVKEGSINNGSTVTVNNYRGGKGKYNFFLAFEDMSDSFDNGTQKGKMVKADNIMFQTRIEAENQTTLGALFDNKFVFCSTSFANGNIAYNKYSEDYLKILKLKSLTCLTINNLINSNVFEVVSSSEEADIDFNNYNKEELIGLFQSV